MEKKIKSKIEIELTEGERDLLYFYLLGVYSLEDIETFEEYPAVVDKLEESITEVAKSTRRRRGVESKMKKLERVKPMALMGMMGEVAPQWVAKELNKIIDHLNSQDQEESEPEKVYVDPIVPDFIAEKLAEERYNTREILLNGTKPLEVESTPEEKEEWVEKLWELIDVYRDSKDINSELEGIEEINQYVKQLLDEREREVLRPIS